MSKRKGLLFMIAASLCWSLGGVCIKFVPWNAMAITGVRSLLAALMFICWRRSVKVKLTRGNILAAIALSATTILFVFANKLTTAAAAILLQFCAPVFIIFIELIFYKKRPKPSQIIAVACTLCGMLLFFAERLDSSSTLGNLLAIASGICFAALFVFNRRPDTDPPQAVYLGFVINSVVGLPFVALGVTAEPSAWIAIAILGLVQVGLAYMLFSVGIKTMPALSACLISTLEPVLNPTLVAIFNGEKPGLYAIAGGAVIVLTVLVFNIWTEKHKLLNPRP